MNENLLTGSRYIARSFQGAIFSMGEVQQVAVLAFHIELCKPFKHAGQHRCQQLLVNMLASFAMDDIQTNNVLVK